MAQHTILVEFYYPSDVTTILSCTTDNKIKKVCFQVSKYATPEEALDAYEQSQVTWCTLLDDDEDYLKFVDEAYEHIKNKDYDWLEKYFI